MQPFVPPDLPLAGLDYRRLLGAVGRANAELARYDGLLQAVVNPDVMLAPLTTQEAVLSSRIEGTQATLEEVLEHEAGDTKHGEKAHDIREIVNYRVALSEARAVLVEQPVTLGLVRQAHRILMDSVRGQDKTPGEFRKDQNWIGRPGCSIAEAAYVPPHPLVMHDHLERWESYVRSEDVDVLVQAAVVHAQFELIHPFKDGNGRIGRLLIPLVLYQKKALSSPNFFLSAYLEARREDYYDRLRAISSDDDWDGWVLFFLEAVEAQARDNGDRVRGMLRLYEQVKSEMRHATRSHYSPLALDALFHQPIFQTSDFIARSGIPKQSALPLLNRLREARLLVEARPARGRRPAIFAFPRLLALLEGHAQGQLTVALA